MTHRPFGITLLAIAGFLQGLVNLVYALQYLGLLPPWLGSLDFYDSSLLGALVFGLGALVGFVVAFGLWRSRTWAWVYVVFVQCYALVVAGLALIGQSSLSALLPQILLAGILLIYCLTPGVRRAFEVTNES